MLRSGLHSARAYRFAGRGTRTDDRSSNWSGVLTALADSRRPEESHARSDTAFIAATMDCDKPRGARVWYVKLRGMPYRTR